MSTTPDQPPAFNSPSDGLKDVEKEVKAFCYFLMFIGVVMLVLQLFL